MNRYSYIHDDHRRICLTIVPGSRWKKKLQHRPEPLDMEIVIVSKNNILDEKYNGLAPEIEWDIFTKELRPKGYITILGSSIGYFLDLYEPL